MAWKLYNALIFLVTWSLSQNFIHGIKPVEGFSVSVVLVIVAFYSCVFYSK